MITAYIGVPGAGKTLHAVRDMRDASKYKVFLSNFAVALSNCISYENAELTPDYLYSFASEFFTSHPFKEGAITLVVDEAQLLFNSRSWSQADRVDWLEFFSQHRHHGFNVILICQSLDMIDKQIRTLVEVEVLHRNWGNFGIYGKVMTLGGRLKLSLALYRYSGIRGEGGTFRKKTTLYTSHDWRLYDSYNHLQG